MLGVTGGIAAYKAATLARLLTGAGASVTTILTESATRFVGSATFAGLTGRPAHVSLWERPGEVLHVRLAHEHDMIVVAPCTANVMAKLALGSADDLLTSTVLEFDGPLLLAPAMHTGMWTSSTTQAHAATLLERGVTLIGPVAGPLAHGDAGVGRMSEPDDIAAAMTRIATARDLTDRTLVVTAGPTHEPIDPVRFIGNRSSGKMGVAIAEVARARGAAVTLILGPGSVDPPAGVHTVAVETAAELREAVLACSGTADAIVMAAAVADFRPVAAADAKLKKDRGVPELVLEPTPDILAELTARSPAGQVVVGFAAETHDVETAGREKLVRKGVDVLVANRVGREHSGFGSDTNEAAIITADSHDEPLRMWTKHELATAIVDRIAASLAGRGRS